MNNKMCNERVVLLTGFEKMVEFLVHKGADIDAVDGHQNTALIFAVSRGNFECCST